MVIIKWVRAWACVTTLRLVRCGSTSPHHLPSVTITPPLPSMLGLGSHSRAPIRWNRIGALAFLFGRIFFDKPASTSSGNALTNAGFDA